MSRPTIKISNIITIVIIFLYIHACTTSTYTVPKDLPFGKKNVKDCFDNYLLTGEVQYINDTKVNITKHEAEPDSNNRFMLYNGLSQLKKNKIYGPTIRGRLIQYQMGLEIHYEKHLKFRSVNILFPFGVSIDSATKEIQRVVRLVQAERENIKNVREYLDTAYNCSVRVGYTDEMWMPADKLKPEILPFIEDTEYGSIHTLNTNSTDNSPIFELIQNIKAERDHPVLNYLNLQYVKSI